MHRLRVKGGLIHPLWFNSLSTENKAIAVSETEVELNREILELVDNSIQFKPGQVVYVYRFNYFYCETEEEKQQREERMRLEQEREKRERKEWLNRLRREAEEFNASLNIPVKWVAGIKPVLSGLSEKRGDGRNERTVVHVLLEEDLTDGRLKRKANSFLCSPSREYDGKLWTDPVEWAVDGEGNRYKPKVTCKKCIKIAERWKIKEVRK